MMRFAGLAVGYASLRYPTGHLALVHGGPTLLAGSTLALVLAGPPASPLPGDEVALA